MKALSIQQPWADYILFRGKDVENRTWKLPADMKGRRIYVHAGKKIDVDACRSPHLIPPERLGAIVGEVTIVECLLYSNSPWFSGPYGFVLRDPNPYDKPIPCRGRLGFFTPEL